MVADHMGHSVNIHTSVYKLQQNLIERSKVAKILSALEDGDLNVKQVEPVALECVDVDNIGELNNIDKFFLYYLSNPLSHMAITCWCTLSRVIQVNIG